jgi:Ankyrin repeats (many copies)
MNKLLLTLVIITGARSLYGMDYGSHNQVYNTVKQSKNRVLVPMVIKSASIELLQTYQQLSHHLCPDMARYIFSMLVKPSPITVPQTYHQLSQILNPDIARSIFSFHLGNVNIAWFSRKINQDYVCPDKLMGWIHALIESCGYSLSVELFKKHFDTAKSSFFNPYEQRSICSIKNCAAETVLHESIYYQRIKVARFSLDVAGDDAWKLLSMQNNRGNTALHYAACKESTEGTQLLLDAAGNDAWRLLKMQNFDEGHTALHSAVRRDRIGATRILLHAAGNKVQDFMAIKANDGKTAFDIAKPYAQEIMKQYM